MTHLKNESAIEDTSAMQMLIDRVDSLSGKYGIEVDATLATVIDIATSLLKKEIEDKVEFAKWISLNDYIGVGEGRFAHWNAKERGVDSDYYTPDQLYNLFKSTQ